MRRRYVFLQGPHGPFFDELASDLALGGDDVVRVGFNRGDEAGWSHRYVAFRKPLKDWETWLGDFLSREGTTDVVLYGDARPVHASARRLATARGIRLHCFEEGYLRPYWITYERGGTNGHSPLMALTMDDIIDSLGFHDRPHREVPANWGSLWHHMWFGCTYHFKLLFQNKKYPNFRTHRDTPVARELWLHICRLLSIPAHAAARRWKTRRLLRSGRPYHVALLQLGHDSAIQSHSPLRSMVEFAEQVIEGFRKGAEPHHVLVFKAHPLEDAREPLRKTIRKAAETAGIRDRVVYIEGGKLGPLLDDATSAVTVNSTAGQQVLWRGLPLKLFGQTIYDKPEFVSHQSVVDFFRAPHSPDAVKYRIFRHFLLKTSQVAGGFYASNMRASARRRVVDMIRAEDDPYGSSRGNPATTGHKEAPQWTHDLTETADLPKNLH